MKEEETNAETEKALALTAKMDETNAGHAYDLHEIKSLPPTIPAPSNKLRQS